MYLKLNNSKSLVMVIPSCLSLLQNLFHYITETPVVRLPWLWYDRHMWKWGLPHEGVIGIMVDDLCLTSLHYWRLWISVTAVGISRSSGAQRGDNQSVKQFIAAGYSDTRCSATSRGPACTRSGIIAAPAESHHRIDSGSSLGHRHQTSGLPLSPESSI